MTAIWLCLLLPKQACGGYILFIGIVVGSGAETGVCRKIYEHPA